MMDEETVTNQIPIANFKSNQLSKKELYIDSSRGALENLGDGMQSPNSAYA